MDLFRRFRFIVLFAVILPATAFAMHPGWYVAIEGGQARYPGISGNAGQWTAAPPSPGPPHRGPSVAVGDGVTAGTVGAVAETASPGRARS